MTEPSAKWQLRDWGEQGVLALIAVLTCVIALWPVTVELAELWGDSDRPYSHGLLVAPVSLWMLLRASRRLHDAPVTGSWLGLLGFCLVLLAWLVGYTANVLAVQELSLPLLLLLAVAAVAGWRAAFVVAFPVGFLYLAIPIWSLLVGPLGAITVSVSGSILDVFRVPVYVDGNLVTIPEGTFEIADGCAGLHYFVVALTLSSLYAYLYFDRLRMRLLLVASLAGLAVLTNWIRVTSLIWIGHVTQMQHYLITESHYYYGWVLFCFALVPWFIVVNRLERAKADREQGLTARARRSSAPFRLKLSPSATVFLIFSVLIAVTVSSRELNVVDPRGLDFIAELPAGQQGWVGPEPAQSEWSPRFSGANGEVLGSYSKAGTLAEVYLAVYRSQAQGRELIGYNNSLSGDGYRQESATVLSLQTGGKLIDVREIEVISATGQRRLIWFWYAIGERLAQAERAAMFWSAAYGLVGKDHGAVIAMSTSCASDCAPGREILQDLARAMGIPLTERTKEYQSLAGRISTSARQPIVDGLPILNGPKGFILSGLATGTRGRRWGGLPQAPGRRGSHSLPGSMPRSYDCSVA